MELIYSEEERVEQKGEETSVVKKARKKSNDTGTEKKTGKHQDMEKRRRKHWTPMCYVARYLR